jgi:glucan phosphoethanolaminetransferase (alkaline phosphatase superfamily)
MTIKKWLNEFASSPVMLFVLYVVVNLLPNLGLIFTEPVNVLGKVILIIFPLGLYFCIFTISRNTGLIQLLLIPLLVIHAFQIVVFYLFGEDVIAVDMFLNVVTTNMTEAGEVLDGIMGAVVFVVIVYIPTILFAAKACKARVYLPDTIKRKLFVSGVVLIICSYLLSFTAKNENTGTFTFHQDVYPVNVIYNLDFAIKKWKISSQYQTTSKDFTFDAHRSRENKEREIYILVIGETSRADNWSLYGYNRETTPYLEKDTNLVFFNDAITQSNTTHKSVPIMMSAASAENFNMIYRQKSILTAFKEVGFETVFLSNQSANHTFTDYYAQEADHIHYYRHFKDKPNLRDNAMLPMLSHYIDSIRGDIFIVMHTYGSHFNYKERYSDDFAKFKPDNTTKINKANRDNLINAYDNTILYTDDFLHRVIDILEKTNDCTSMFFVSDHGEDILDDKRERFLHASPNPTIYQLRIPMLVWFSPMYKDSYPDNVRNATDNKLKPVATNAVFHTLLDIAGIETDYLYENLSLVSDRFKVEKRIYLSDHDDPVLFYNAGLKKEDKIYIKEKNIYH